MNANLATSVAIHTSEVSDALNSMGFFPLNYDQTKGNLCHTLTLYVFSRLAHENDLPIRRELHSLRLDNDTLWHYLLAHHNPDALASDSDIISDLNPWQWGGAGSGILHGPRQDVMQKLEDKGAPDWFIALRGVDTIKKIHTTERNPYNSRATS